MVGVSKGPDSVRLIGGPDDAVRPMIYFHPCGLDAHVRPKEVTIKT